MLKPYDYVYHDEITGKFLGTFVYIVHPLHIKYDVAPGMAIKEAADAAIHLANRLNADVNMPFNDVMLNISCLGGISSQDVINKYFESLRAR